ncbi:MAG: right-handed parallel beta-helix repeat-containing protein, partial [Candidatus Limnocylindrales bacterium]
SDGDTILIAPGTYVENLYIDRALTLVGDGPREQVVILRDESDRQIVDVEPAWPRTRRNSPQDRPVNSSLVTIHVDGADVTIESLSIVDEDDALLTSLLLDGGTSTARDIYANGFVGVRGDTSTTIEDSDIERLGSWGTLNHTVVTGNEIRDLFFGSEGATGRVEGNIVHRNIVIEQGASYEVVGNHIVAIDDEPGIVIWGPETIATVIGNDVAGGPIGISVEFAGESLVEGNTVHGSGLGVRAIETTSTIAGNTIRDVTDVGILAAGQGMTVTDNDISGGRLGIHALSIDYRQVPPFAPRFDEPPRILDNSISEASHFALVIEEDSPSVSGNRLCSGRQAIKIVGDSDPSIGTNEICEVDG